MIRRFVKKLSDEPISHIVLFMAGLLVGVLLTYERDDPPAHRYTYYLPDAVAGKPYQVEVEVAGVWQGYVPLKFEANRYLDIESLSPDRIRLSHLGQFHEDEKAYGIWLIGGGGQGGGSSYVRHEYGFYVAVRDGDEGVINECLTVVDHQRAGAVYYQKDDKRPCVSSLP